MLNTNKCSSSIKLIHLNVNSIINKLYDIDQILSSNQVDVLMLSETKLDDEIPNSFYQNNNYFKLRLDRNSKGGGLLVFIKNGLMLTKSKFFSNIELIYFQLKISSQVYNFIYCYRQPILNEIVYLYRLESILHSLNLNDPLFIVGDLNMNILNNENSNLNSFLANNELMNFIDSPTRTSSKYCSYSKKVINCQTLIDVVIHNGNLIVDSNVIECPFSDHDFVVVQLKILKPVEIYKTINCRNLNSKNLTIINELIEKGNFKLISEIDDINQKWTFVKNEITNILNQVAPEKTIRLRQSNIFPWFDDELLYTRYRRDSNYKRFAQTGDYFYRAEFLFFKKLYQSQHDSKMIDFFKNQNPQDFKNSKQFWRFYSSRIKIKSDNSSKDSISHIIVDEHSVSDKNQISELFNCFFTSIKTSSSISLEESVKRVDNQMKSMIDILKIKPPGFKFSLTNASEIESLTNELVNSTNPGCCEISARLLKNGNKKLFNIIAYVFNSCLIKSTIPDE
ncbi:unnamed protein product [Brachionus calyciflorus]|uniref:Endonuclease/exonuclease/phosphatase domain-containing protein n=1 Tax=Brachionus calyciflorus TaxID=104777 RepID=A0A814REL5_9BILA|nr:unnamed protein product [Brachionus calyciflorus]